MYFYTVLISFPMKTVSLKIDDSIFGETEKILSRIKKPRNRYINEALEYYNRLQRRLMLEKKLKAESAIVNEESMAVLAEFEMISDDR
jgi:predicted transcriptional regulator